MNVGSMYLLFDILVVVIPIEKLVYSSFCSPWVNDTDPWFVDFNKAQFLFNLDYSSSNAIYLVEADFLTSCKADNCFEFVFRFTSNGILKPLVSIISTDSLAISVKYVEHSWIVRAHALYGKMLDDCKNLSKR